MFEFPRHPDERQLRQFATVGLLPATAIAAGLAWRWSGGTAAAIIAAGGVTLCLLGWLRPRALWPVFLTWMAAVWPLGWLLGLLLLAFTFYLVITPLGLVLRLFGHDPLGRRRDAGAETYWRPARGAEDRARYFRQF